MRKTALLVALAAVMLVSVVGAAFADTATYNNNAGEAFVTGGPVAVKASVKPKLTLTLTTPDGAAGELLLDWSTPGLLPGDDPAAKNVGLKVDSNKSFTIGVTEDLADFTAAGFTFTRSLADGTAGAKGQNQTFTDTLDFGAISWDVEPGDYTGSITYTVTQD